jgi:radical SAM protein with 4Fe4S-binding SPASM domain
MSTTWGTLSGRLVKNSMEQKLPLIGEFELTGRCNLSCGMCYVNCLNQKEAEKKERSAKEWIGLAKEAFDAGMLFLLLTGGEIFIRKDFPVIYEELAMMGFNITLYTNGTLITPQIASWLGRLRPSQIEVTLYGASQTTYKKVCGNAEGFRHTLRGIELLLAQGINVQVRTSIIKENVNDFESMAELTKKFGLQLGIVNYISPRRDGENSILNTRLSPKETASLEKRIEEYNIRDNTSLACVMEDISHVENTQEQSFQFYDINDPFQCGSAKNSFWITWEGKMVPCSFMNQPSTLPFEKGFMTSWKELIELCSLVPVCKSCSECELSGYCTTCPAKLYNETGSYEKASHYLCELARERKQVMV